jgi:LysR family transcriptional activator of mexEF-oprN operon
LRDLFDDPLLLRNGRGMEPTARALAILKELQPAMDVISGAVSRAKEFEPASSCDVFPHRPVGRRRIWLVSAVVASASARGAGHCRGRAPRQLLVDAGTAGLGEISVGVSYTTELPANAKRKKLRDIPCKVLRGDDRPGPLTLDEYCERPHAMVSFSGDLSGNIDMDLAKVGAVAAWSSACRSSAACAPCSPAPR